MLIRNYVIWLTKGVIYTAGTYMIKVNEKRLDGLFDEMNKTGTLGQGAASTDASAAVATAAGTKKLPATKQPVGGSTQPVETKKPAVTAALDSQDLSPGEYGALMHALNQVYTYFVHSFSLPTVC